MMAAMTVLGERLHTTWLGPVCTLPFIVAGAWLVVAHGGRVVPSSDPGAGSVDVAWLWLAAAGLAIAAVATSRHLEPSIVTERNRQQSTVELVGLLVCAIAFPLLLSLPLGWHPLDYAWVKVLLLLALPGGLLWLSRRRAGGPSIVIHRPTVTAGMLLGAVAGTAWYLYVTQLSPAAPSIERWPDLVTLIVAATFTALTASIGEEVFYRYWLQSRLEARLGRWPGTLLASLVFALMHLASHGGDLGVGSRLASVVAVQGVFGIAAGLLWSRYRRLWLPILLHLGTNGLLVVVHLVGVAAG